MHSVLVPAFNPGSLTGDGNNTYLVGDEAAVLIDAGTGEPRHLDALAGALRAGNARLGLVLVTHGHSDHASGAEALAGRWPDVSFVKMPWPERDRVLSVRWQALSDNELIPVGNRALRAIHTPGHSPDHVCFWDESTRTLYSGDLVISGNTVVIPASAGGSLAQYLESLRRVLYLEPVRMLPAHGAAIERPAEILDAYLRHRQQREEQVLAALRAGCRTREAMADRIYQGLAPDLWSAARENVLAHLMKLSEEGAVIREGDEWREP